MRSSLNCARLLISYLKASELVTLHFIFLSKNEEALILNLVDKNSVNVNNHNFVIQ
jgi:hypothetical protein